MKHIAKMLLCLVLAVGLVYTPVCLPVLQSTPVVATAEAASVKISKKSATIYAGTTLQLKMKGTKKKVTWSTSKKSVATVSSKGKVTAKKAGTATIKAKVGKKTYSCKVTVKAVPKLNITKKTVYVGDTVSLKLKGTVIGTTKWTTSNKSVATVSSKGKVTAKKKGTATIKATVGGKTLSCKLTVKAKPVVKDPVEEDDIIIETPVVNVTSVNIPSSSINLTLGGTQTLSATVSPSNATDKTVVWSSDNTAVAIVDQSGKVTAIGEGQTKIWAKAGGKSDYCTVYVKVPSVESVTLDKTSLTLNVGDMELLMATINPYNAKEQTVTWSTSNKKIATVDEDGVVTAIAPGSTKITAKVGTKSATCTVTVNTPTFDMGQVWEVDGQWRFKVNSMTTHYKCNKYDTDPGEQVVTISYTYWCDGPTAYSGGLAFRFTDFKVYDQNGEVANHYTCIENSEGKYITEGKTCNATTSFILMNTSDNITFDVSKNTVDSVTQKASFKVNMGSAPEQPSEPSTPVEPDTPSTPDEPSDDTETGVTKNLTTLKNYITNSGSTNTAGNKFIKKEISSSSGTTVGAIVYDKAEDVFNFICTNELSSGAETSISMKLNRTASGTVQPEIILLYEAAGMGFQSHANFAPGTYDGAETVSFTVDSSVGVTNANVQSLSNSALKLAFTSWELVLVEKTGLTLSDIGFTEYDSSNAETESPTTQNLTTLKNYITNNGSTNTSGNKFIKKQLTSSSGTTVGAIVYDKSADVFNFICTNELSSGAETSISMKLNRTASGTVQPEIILVYEAAGMGFMSHANFAPGTYDGEKTVSFTVDSSVGVTNSNVQSLSNSALKLAFTAWEAVLYEKTGLQLKDIGFTKFDL